MDYDNLLLAHIPAFFPKEQQIQASHDFVQRFAGFLPRNLASRIEAYADDQFVDVLLASLRDDEIFQRLTNYSGTRPLRLLCNYFIMNYSPYLRDQLLRQLLDFARPLSCVVVLDSFVWKANVLGYFQFLCCVQRDDHIFVDVAKSLFVIRFWQRLYRWINLQVHENLVRLRQQEFCQDTISGLESRPTQTSNIFNDSDPRQRWAEFVTGTWDAKRPHAIAEDSSSSQFGRAEMQTVATHSQTQRLDGSLFDVLQSEFEW